MNFGVVGALGLGLAVMLGAFGAHALRDRLDVYRMGVYEKAVFYHFVHTLGILIAAMLPKAGLLSQSTAIRVCTLLLCGVLLFSGSLYALALTGNRMLGAITPFGGLSFIAAWFVLAWGLLRR